MIYPVYLTVEAILTVRQLNVPNYVCMGTIIVVCPIDIFYHDGYIIRVL